MAKHLLVARMPNMYVIQNQSMVVDDSRINHDTGNDIETLVPMLHVDQLKFSAAQLPTASRWMRQSWYSAGVGRADFAGVIDSLEKTRRVFQVRWKVGKTLQQSPFRMVVGCSY